jgi:large subunit ribosomal protein L22
MAVRAKSKGVGVSAKKMRIVCDMVRGKDVETAVNLLRFTQSPSAEIVMKTINSAVANAENNELMGRDGLRISLITVDEGPSLRRFRPKARGRAGSFDRPSCHLIVEVDDGSNNE